MNGRATVLRPAIRGGIYCPRMGEMIPFRPTGLGARRPCRRAVPADVWYERAVAREEAGPEDAIALYARALAANPEHADAHCNAGRLLHERGDREAAEAHYRLALCARADVGLYWFNLGVAVEDDRRRGEAIDCYRAAIALDPLIADAHWNLARLLDVPGDAAAQREALCHLATYRALREAASR
jgi:tetratricopeptide (TPR) repeat protein